MRQEIKGEEIKKVELDVLKWFDQFCGENGLQYYLGYGTLLGAVRHHGFIPWDDDIDVVMIRSQYNKLIELLRNEKGRYQLLEHSINPDYLYPYGKICDTETILIEEEVDCGTELGIYIDIFPLDYDSREGYHQVLREKHLNLWFQLLGYGMSRTHHGKGIRQIVGKAADKLFIHGKQGTITEIIVRLSTKQKSGQYYMNSVWSYKRGTQIPTHVFDECVSLQFEDSKFKAPAGYEEWLTIRYGDYMKLPPENQRVSIHNFKAYWRE